MEHYLTGMMQLSPGYCSKTDSEIMGSDYDKTHCKPFDLGNLSSGYLDRPMDANHTPSLEYTLLGRGLFFNSEVFKFSVWRLGAIEGQIS